MAQINIMKEIKLIAQPQDTIFFLDEYGYIVKGELQGVSIYKDGSVEYRVIATNTFFYTRIIGNTVDELLQNLKNEYLQRTPST